MKRFHLFLWEHHIEYSGDVSSTYKGVFETLQDAKNAVNPIESVHVGEILELKPDGSLKPVSALWVNAGLIIPEWHDEYDEIEGGIVNETKLLP